MRSAISGHPRIAAGAVALVIAAAVFVLVFFQPQKLFIQDKVNEAAPSAPAVPRAPGSPAKPAQSRTRTLSSGGFASFEHATRGQAKIIDSSGKRYLRFEGFSTSNGPQLKVYLSAAAPGGPPETFDDRFLDLGDLKGNVGDQNYAIPAGVDLKRYRSVVVWCKRFSVAFGAAPVSA